MTTKPTQKGYDIDTTDENLYPHIQFEGTFLNHLDSAVYPYNSETTLLKEYLIKTASNIMKCMGEYGIDSVTLHFKGAGDSADEFEVDAIGRDIDGFLNTRIETINYEVVTRDGTKVIHDITALSCVPTFHDISVVPKLSLADALVEDVVSAFLYICLHEKYRGWENNDGGYGTVTLNRLGQVLVEMYQITIEHDYCHFSVSNETPTE